MSVLLALVPCVVVVVAVLLLRVSGVMAAVYALLSALLIWALAPLQPRDTDQLRAALADALVLELLVGLVVYTGLMFVEASTRAGAPAVMRALIEKLELPDARAAILIATGIGVTVESLTGYGVSMLVTVPLLLLAVSRRRAIVLALIGMSLMPWGALSVAALVGAELAALPVAVLAAAVLATSGPVAALLPLACLLVVGSRRLADLIYALTAGAVLATGIALSSYAVGVELAGVGGGLAVIALSVAVGRRAAGFGATLRRRELWPLFVLMIAVVVQKWLLAQFDTQLHAWSVSTGRVTFVPLASPALALLLAAVFALACAPASAAAASSDGFLHRVNARAWRALAAIFLFLLTARILLETGAIAALAGALAALGHAAALVSVALLGAVGAYVTGSGVTANALFMPGAATAGAGFDAVALFAALQHSAAGHTAMASLPVVAVLLAALPQQGRADEQHALRSGMLLAAVWVVVVIASGLLQSGMAHP